MHLLAANIGGSFFKNDPNHFLTKITGLGTLVSLFLSNSILVAGILLLFLIIITGYLVIGAGGDPQKLQIAMKTITYALSGFLLIFATYFIIRIVEAMTGLFIL